MPTAVMMGMGLTPQLASASPRGAEKLKAGPCVSQPDEADQHAADAGAGAKDGSKNASKDAAKSQDTAKSGEKSAGQHVGKDAKSGTSDRDKAKSGPSPSPSPSADSATPAPSPSGTPGTSSSSSNQGGLLDTLGLDGLTDTLLGGGDSGTAQPGASPSPSASATPSSGSSTDQATKSATSTVDQATKDVDHAAGTAKDTLAAVKDAADKAANAAGETEKAGTKATGQDAVGSSDAQGYPCPTHDADALANAPTEQTPAVLPDVPWTLKSSMLTLHGLQYHGIVNVRTQNGSTKQVLKFTASGVDIGDLHQTVAGPDGTTTNVQARAGSTSTIRNGTVTMYTESLSGNLLGLVPITFTPDFPPPLTLPELFFTNVTVLQAGQFGGTLTIPGMHLYQTGK
jgi:hypothetical protein